MESAITNFRDIGGIPVKDGTLVKGKFFRSGELVQLTSEDIYFLKEVYDIKKIYDFRGHTEIIDKPDTLINGIENENIDILATATMKNVSFSAMIKNSKNGDTINCKMLETYSEIITSQSALEGYKIFLEDILVSNHGILFHCFAGKDRTGIGSALILKIAGATDAQIIDDYLKTNVMRKLENQKIIKSLQNHLTTKQLTALSKALNVNLDYLNHAKEILLKTYGTFDTYLYEGLKLDKNYIDHFKEKFIRIA